MIDGIIPMTDQVVPPGKPEQPLLPLLYDREQAEARLHAAKTAIYSLGASSEQRRTAVAQAEEAYMQATMALDIVAAQWKVWFEWRHAGHDTAPTPWEPQDILQTRGDVALPIQETQETHGAVS